MRWNRDYTGNDSGRAGLLFKGKQSKTFGGYFRQDGLDLGGFQISIAIPPP